MTPNPTILINILVDVFLENLVCIQMDKLMCKINQQLCENSVVLFLWYYDIVTSIQWKL